MLTHAHTLAEGRGRRRSPECCPGARSSRAGRWRSWCRAGTRDRRSWRRCCRRAVHEPKFPAGGRVGSAALIRTGRRRVPLRLWRVSSRSAVRWSRAAGVSAPLVASIAESSITPGDQALQDDHRRFQADQEAFPGRRQAGVDLLLGGQGADRAVEFAGDLRAGRLAGVGEAQPLLAQEIRVEAAEGRRRHRRVGGQSAQGLHGVVDLGSHRRHRVHQQAAAHRLGQLGEGGRRAFGSGQGELLRAAAGDRGGPGGLGGFGGLARVEQDGCHPADHGHDDGDRDRQADGQARRSPGRRPGPASTG